MRAPRILLAEDQLQVLHFLQAFPEPIYNVVGAAQDEETLFIAATVLKPDFLVIDIDLPKLNGIESIRQIKRIAPNCCMILKSCYAEPKSMGEAYAAGAAVYLVKGPLPSMILTIRALVDQPRWTYGMETASPVETPDLTTYGFGMS